MKWIPQDFVTRRTITIAQAEALLADEAMMQRMGWSAAGLKKAIEIGKLATASIKEKHDHERGKLDALGKLVDPE